jgi:hypothetical protein
MSFRLLACVTASIVIAFSGTVLAQEQDSVLEMKRIQVLLAVINAELKSDLDQVLLLQEAIRANAQPPLEAQGRSPDAVYYDDVAAAKRRAIQRETAINARLDAILARTADLEAKKQPLLERIRELSLIPEVQAAKPPTAPRPDYDMSNVPAPTAPAVP